MSKAGQGPDPQDWYDTTLRVRYADTDRMGVVYHSNYFVYFEACRAELIRRLWKPYSQIEKDGYLLLVIEAFCHYHRGAEYDDVLTVRARVADFSDTRIRFEYQVFRNEGEAPLVEGFTEHCFADLKGKPRRMPEELKQILSKPMAI